jgi:hypothetical protein
VSEFVDQQEDQKRLRAGFERPAGARRRSSPKVGAQSPKDDRRQDARVHAPMEIEKVTVAFERGRR